MYRASPLRLVAGLSKENVGAAEVLGIDFDADDFVNLWDSRTIHNGGFAHGRDALFPDKDKYDLLVFAFGAPTLTDVDDATLTVWAVGSEGVPYPVGRSELGADGLFGQVLVDNYQARYFVSVGSLDETSAGTADFSVPVFVGGTYRFYVAGNR